MASEENLYHSIGETQHQIGNAPIAEKLRRALIVRVSCLEVFCDETGDYVRVAATKGYDSAGILVPIKDVVAIERSGGATR